ncbi:Mce protein [Mycobacterium sp. ITM-2016-00317]|uniref:Mce protein n=1 Tax=Mycobacterium sp. ITM-2016-00317 TaxID=2099694 RepID=UPI000D47A8F5|nr:Mce protein [Mycobacterium sp. ITM-2016-00317]WNG86360.1 Mce protein [Mycobacterium sp. ITM-2016-00317]
MADDAAAPDGELKKPTAQAGEPESGTVEPESGAVEAADSTDSAADETVGDEAVAETVEDTEPATRNPISHVKLALIAGIVAVVALAALTGWLGYRTYESDRAEAQRNVFLQVGRQGAVNLTTIDWENADADVQRILDSATGTFYDEFQQRAEPFVEVVKQAQSKSVGTVAEAGLESVGDNEAQVLVAVTVQTTNAGAPEQQPRAWRMRISVQEVDGDAKVSKVEFVP